MMFGFLLAYRHNRAFGFPVLWSIRTAWAWRNGPNASMLQMRNDYVQLKRRRFQKVYALEDLIQQERNALADHLEREFSLLP